MDKKLYKIWEELKPLEIEHQNIIMMEGYVTGSCAFGCLTPESDNDYLLLVEESHDFEFFKDIINRRFNFEYMCYGTDYSDCTHVAVYVKFKGNSRPINLLLFDNLIEYRRWVWATRIMKILLKSDKDFVNKIEDRKNRIALFATLREIY